MQEKISEISFLSSWPTENCINHTHHRVESQHLAKSLRHAIITHHQIMKTTRKCLLQFRHCKISIVLRKVYVPLTLTRTPGLSPDTNHKLQIKSVWKNITYCSFSLNNFFQWNSHSISNLRYFSLWLIFSLFWCHPQICTFSPFLKDLF